MKIGVTSFAFRFQLADPALAPTLFEVVEQTAAAGVQRLQLCENSRPLDLPLQRWAELFRCAQDCGIELHLGTKTTDPEVFFQYHERAVAVGSRQVRLVLESHKGIPATRDAAMAFLDSILPILVASNSQVAIENYFGIACRDLAEWCSGYPADRIGFCVDSANSLRKFEPLEEVLSLLSERALCWHVKDWKLLGTDTGFSVIGALLGTGDLPLEGLIRHIRRCDSNPVVYLENWPLVTGDRVRDIETDREMLLASIQAWRAAWEGFQA